MMMEMNNKKPSKKEVSLALENRFILQRLKLDQYETTALKNIQKLYVKALNKAKIDLSKMKVNPLGKTRIKIVIKQLKNELVKINKQLEKKIAKTVAPAGKFSYLDTGRILSFDSSVPNFTTVVKSAKEIESLALNKSLGGMLLGQWVGKLSLDLFKELEEEILAGYIRGVGYKKLMQELGTKYNSLIKQVGKRNDLETIVKSYIQAINAKAHHDLYEANKDLIKGVTWNAVLENANSKTGRGTCPRCMALDGQEFDEESDAPPMPLHPRCRCFFLPILNDYFFSSSDDKRLRRWTERNLSTRKKLEGGFREGTFKNMWFSKPKGWQDSAIGVKRANLIRGRKVKFEDMVDSKGNLIPIKDL